MYTGWPREQKPGTVDFLGLCSDQWLSFFTFFPNYNNTTIIKFG